jgi:hypothetical protein
MTEHLAGARPNSIMRCQPEPVNRVRRALSKQRGAMRRVRRRGRPSAHPERSDGGEHEAVAGAVHQAGIAQRPDNGLRVEVFDLPPDLGDRPERRVAVGVGQ